MNKNFLYIVVTIFFIICTIIFALLYGYNKNDNQSFIMKEKCSKMAADYFEEIKNTKFDLENYNYSNHYSKKTNSCILFTGFSWSNGTHYNIYSVEERKELAWLVYLLSEPIECKILNNTEECNYDKFFDYKNKIMSN